MIDQHEDFLLLLVISLAIHKRSSSQKRNGSRLKNEQGKEKKNENISCESANIFFEKINEII